MKKLATGIVSAGLLTMMILLIQANDTAVSYSQSSSYVLSIPDTIELNSASSKSLAIGVQNVNTTPEQKVQVKASGLTNGKVTLTRASKGDTIQVTVSKSENGSGISDTDVLAEFQDQSTTAVSGGTIWFAAVGNVPAGTYSGTITFTGSYANR